MKIGYLLSALLIVLVSISIIPPASAQTGWYFGLGTGEAESDVGLSDLDVDGSLTSGSVDDSDTGTKVFGGFRFSEKVAVEAALVDLGEESIDATSSGGFFFAPGPASAEADADGISIAVVGIWPVGGKVAVIGKLGFFSWDSDVSISNSAFGTVSDDDSGTDLMLGLGGQFEVGKKVGIRVEFERFTDVGEVDVDLVSVSIFFVPQEK